MQNFSYGQGELFFFNIFGLFLALFFLLYLSYFNFKKVWKMRIYRGLPPNIQLFLTVPNRANLELPVPTHILESLPLKYALVIE